jgi:hypothetical protein
MLWLVGQRTLCLCTVVIHAERLVAGKSEETLAHKVSTITSFIVSKYIKTRGHQKLPNSTLSKQRKPKLITKVGEKQHEHCRLTSRFHISYRVLWITLYPLPSLTYIPALSLFYCYLLSFFLRQNSEIYLRSKVFRPEHELPPVFSTWPAFCHGNSIRGT